MNIDKTRKVVSIILMCLMIGGFVFNAFNIIGHCETVSRSELPLYVGAGWGNTFTQSEYDQIVSSIQSYISSVNDSDFPYVNTIVLWDYDSQGIYYFRVYADTIFEVQHPSLFFSSGSTLYLYSQISGHSWSGFGQVQYNSNTGVVSNFSYSNQGTNIYSSSFIDNGSMNSGVIYAPSVFYISGPLSYFDTTYFVPDPLGSSSGHSKGGDITQYTYDPADTPEPADPSAVAGGGGWLSKILDSLNKIKNGIVYGFQNITDNLQSFFNQIYGGIENQLNQIIEKLGGESLDTSDTSLSDVFLTTFQGSKIYGVYSTYTQGRDIVQGLFNSIETPETLRFEFDLPTMNLGGHSQGGSSNPSYITKPYGNKLVMDFGWYENVRNIIVPFVVAWLYVGMLIWLLRAIPGFISGSPSVNTRSVSDGSPIVNGHNEVYEYTDYNHVHHKKPMFRL